jgi:type VI secretion system secreted protein VgrG
VVQFSAREALSSVYEASVVLALEPGGPPLDGLVGEDALLEVLRGPLARRLRGVIRQVDELGSTALHRFVRVEVVPALWTLSQRSDSRIFQQMNVLAIAREVLRVAGVYQGPGALRADASLEAQPPREYCVQYQETDLDFVRRLLEEEGIPFYFAHDGAEGEALVLAGDAHVYASVETLDGGAVRMLDAGDATGAAESLRWFDERHRMQPTSVTVRDFDFSRPRAPLSPTWPARPGPRALYEYPARASLTRYDDASRTYQAENTARLARVRQEVYQTRAHEGRGRGNVAGFAPGSSFALDGHELPEANRVYLLVAVEHTGQSWTELPEDVRASERVLESLQGAGISIEEGERRRGHVSRYVNRFTAARLDGIETSVPFRPERTIARPIVEGPQTAWVVGPPGEDIHTDPHGRIKVQFHWDRLGQGDDRSSCWIRVAQSSSGGGFGFTILPRIGMEVVVSFLEGDPDRPMVTGCVNNGENGTSYPLPEAKTKSVVKTWSTPRSGGYNELRFEDAAGREQMYVQAERDHDTLVKHDQTITVQRHRTKRVQGDEHNTVEQNRVTHVMLDNTRYVDGNQEVEVHGPYGCSLRIDANHDVTVGQNQVIDVTGDQSTRVAGDCQRKVGGDLSVSVKGAMSTSVAKGRSVQVAKDDGLSVGGDLGVTGKNVSLSAGTKASFGAGAQLVISVGKSSITLESDRILLQSSRIEMFGEKHVIVEGAVVKVNCGEKPEPPKDTRTALEKLVDRIKNGWKKFLAKLPKPLAGLVDKLVTPVLHGAIEALKSGELPKLDELARGAVQGAIQSTVGSAFAAIGSIPGVSEIPGATELLARAQEKVMGAVMKGVDAMGMMQKGLAGNPRWEKLLKAYPKVATQALRQAGWPIASEALNASWTGMDLPQLRELLGRGAPVGEVPVGMIPKLPGGREAVLFDVAAKATSQSVTVAARYGAAGGGLMSLGTDLYRG